MQKLLIASLLLLAACNKPSLPDPRIEYPKAPDILMEAPRKMQTINEN